MPLMTPDEEPATTEPAGLGRRLGAMFYDSLLLFALAWGITAAEVGLRAWREGESAIRASGRAAAGGLALQLPLAIVVILFFGWFWTRGGQTLGMQAWRLRVETEHGARLGWPQVLARLAGALVSMSALGAGYWAALFDRERRTWHDRWTKTRVVRVPGV